jgi:DNA-binding transcriptional LysR family regulator
LLRGAVRDVAQRPGPTASFDGVLHGVSAVHLNALNDVVRHGSFSSAAGRTGLARAALHHAVRQLESVLEVQLLERGGYRVRPTRDGERLALQIRLSLAELAQARAEMAAAAGRGSGTTVIGAMPLARSALVPKATLRFTRLQPEHAVSILDGPYETLLTALRDGTADIVIGAMRERGPPGDVIQEHLFDDPLAIIVRAGHPLSTRRRLTREALASFDWIAPRAESPLRQHFDRLYIEGPEHAVPIECNSWDAARALLLESDRVMLLSRHQAHVDLESGCLAALRHPFGTVLRPIGLTLRRSWYPTDVQRKLLEALRAEAGRLIAAPARPTRTVRVMPVRTRARR